MNQKHFAIAGFALILVGIGFSIRSEFVFRLGKKEAFEQGRRQGMRDTMQLISDLGMEGKVVHMGLPVGSNRWMNMKYEVIHSGLTVEQASNLWFAAMFAKTNSTSITISNASEKTITVTFPMPTNYNHPYIQEFLKRANEAKEAK